jgi:hypothetical protein
VTYLAKRRAATMVIKSSIAHPFVKKRPLRDRSRTHRLGGVDAGKWALGQSALTCLGHIDRGTYSAGRVSESRRKNCSFAVAAPSGGTERRTTVHCTNAAAACTTAMAGCEWCLSTVFCSGAQGMTSSGTIHYFEGTLRSPSR